MVLDDVPAHEEERLEMCQCECTPRVGVGVYIGVVVEVVVVVVVVCISARVCVYDCERSLLHMRARTSAEAISCESAAHAAVSA